MALLFFLSSFALGGKDKEVWGGARCGVFSTRLRLFLAVEMPRHVAWWMI